MFGRAEPNADLKVLWSVKLSAQVLGIEVEHFVERRSSNVSVTYFNCNLLVYIPFVFCIFNAEGIVPVLNLISPSSHKALYK